MSKKVPYVTGGMGGIGTAICQRLAKDGFTVIAGCGPTRDHAKWLGEQKAEGYEFHALAGMERTLRDNACYLQVEHYGVRHEELQALMARCGFKARGFFVMDGSKRSAHSNAYFTGLGNAKRVVLTIADVERLAQQGKVPRGRLRDPWGGALYFTTGNGPDPTVAPGTITNATSLGNAFVKLTGSTTQAPRIELRRKRVGTVRS